VAAGVGFGWWNTSGLLLDSQPPVPTEGEEHAVVGITVYAATDHFAIRFRVASGRTLGLRLHSDVLAELGQMLLDLAEERGLHGDV